MRPWLWTVAALFVVTGLSVRADYVIIKINLAAAKDPDVAANQQQPGLGGPGGPGGMNMGGGAPGPGGLNMGGGGPGPGGLNMGGGMGLNRGGLGQQMGGGRGQGMPGMGPGGQGGAGRGGMRGEGAGGRMGGAPGPGGLNMGGGPGGMRMGGGPGMGEGGGSFTSRQGGLEEDEDSTPQIVGTVLEVDHNNIQKANNGRYRVKTKWGHTSLPFPNQNVVVDVEKMDTVAKRFAKEREKIKEDSPDHAEALRGLASWALEHGLHDRVREVMDELGKVDSKNAAYVAFQRVQNDLDRKLTADDAAVSWRDRLGEFKRRDSAHYILLHDYSDVKKDLAEDAVNGYLGELERNYRGFFYWFALQGKALPVPDRRLVAVLVHESETFDRQHKDIFDDAAMVADGFFLPRENLAVFSANRLDEAYVSLEKFLEPVWQKYTQKQLIKGEIKRMNNEIAMMETLAMVRQAMLEEAMTEAVTHEGTRQLVTATGLLPRGVEAPKWIDFGLASFFETPKGSFWSGTGGASFAYLPKLKAWRDTKQKQYEKDPAFALRAVVTDRFFHEIKDDKDKDTQQIKARAMAWALTYYLAQKHSDGLLRYYEELSNLPRDLEFDEDVLLGCFARAFGLADASNPQQIDPSRWASFANKWYQMIKDTPNEVEVVFKDAVDSFKKKDKPRATAPQGGGGGNNPVIP